MRAAPSNVYLADLRHNYSGVLVNDCMPLAIGFMKAVMDRELAHRAVISRLFAYPDRLLEAMRAAPADILMVSNYVWNEQLSLLSARIAKQLNPDCVTVMGGPNLPTEAERQIEFLAERPELDIYVCGEGDFLASQLVEAFIERGRTRAGLCAGDLPSCVYRRADGEIVRTATQPRMRHVDEIPSPYLTGIMDEFFDGKLAPFIETNRGCPFRCTFCIQGSKYYTKVHYFDLERVREEIDYIAEMVHERSPEMGTLRIADSNYGMYERDVEISGHIGKMQKRYGWPTFIDATTGKNKAERIMKSLEQVGGALALYQAVQSLDDEVLRNIDRSTIKLDSYQQIAVELRGRGLRAGADLILGLPGESLETHLNGLYSMIDAGAEQAHCFQAMMLKGAQLETRDSRERFGFDTRYRVLPKNFGVYEGEKVFDIEEIVVATNTLPFADYVTCRKHHLVFSVFWNDSWFRHPAAIARRFGIERSTWLKRLLHEMEASDGAVRQLLDAFVEETIGELFPSREACAAFYSEEDNFARLCGGELGDNLMYGYRARASFLVWHEVCAFAMATTRQLLAERGARDRIADFDRVWDDLSAYVEASHASGITPDTLLAPVAVELSYDIHRWLADGAPDDVQAYRFAEPRTFLFHLSEQAAEELEAALRVWTAQLSGLSKLVTRIRVSSQVRAPSPAMAGPGTDRGKQQNAVLAAVG